MPRVVIVGFPNAGKSTLFNRLARTKKALVHSLPGMTRSRVSAFLEVAGKPFELVDTGGFLDTADEPLSPKVKAAAWDAARTADVLLLVLDGKRGLIPAEEELSRDLVKLDKPLIVVVNKIDTESERPAFADYYRLGTRRLFALSAEHKIGISALETAIAEVLPETSGPAAGAAQVHALKIAIIGRVNVGKSSLANRLCGEERFIVDALPGTTRDTSDVFLRHGEKAYVLVDTAGIRKLGRVADVRESAGVIKARKSIPRADVLCLVLDALEFPTRQDAAVATLAFESGKPLVIAINKWDIVREDMFPLRQASEIVFSRLDFVSYAPLVAVSALTGKRVTKILDLAEDVHRDAQKRVPTPQLNRFLEAIGTANPPVSPTGRRFKVRYMTQKGILPPTFVLFTSTGTSFAPAYEKFFVHKLRETFGFRGSPIKLILRSKKR
jgi:GTP-binding protein